MKKRFDMRTSIRNKMQNSQIFAIETLAVALCDVV